MENMAVRYTVEGNTARRLERSGSYEWKRQSHLREYDRKRNSLQVDALSIILTIGAVAGMIAMLFYYVNLQSSVTRYREEYGSMLSDYEEQKRMNDLYEERIVNNVDMNEIERIAREELGMKVAGEGQIVYYAGAMDDYVRQYADIPR